MDVIRSLLFVPGNRQNMMDRASSVPADALIPDLEDSVPPDEKANAREIVSKNLPTLAQAGQLIFPRVNSLDTPYGWEDLKAIIGQPISGISIGKVTSAEDVRHIDALLGAIEKEKGVEVGSTRLILWIELAKAIINAFQICDASPRVLGVAFGAEDLSADLEVEKSEEDWQFLYARSQVAMAAKAAGVMAFASVYTNFRDQDGLVVTAKKERLLGFRGKFAIHPSQVEPMNTVFAPSQEEIERARRIVAAFDEAQAQGRASTSLDGQMIDIPVVKRAQNLLAQAEAIARKGRRT